MAEDRQRKNPADLIRVQRLGLHRELDRLIAKATVKGAKGNFALYVPFIDGRLGDPQVTFTRHGFSEE